jgi:hypothetical protein
MKKHFQTICNIKNYDRDSYVDMSSFKNGSFCILYEDWIDYYSKHYEYLCYINLNYGPTHLLTLTINSELYVIIRNNKSIYLYLIKNEFLYKTQIHLMSEIVYWTKTKDNQIIICSKNKISFYKIYKNSFLKTQNDIQIEEEKYIENSLYFKNEKEDSSIDEYENEENTNFQNLTIVKIFELNEDYFIIIKQKIDKIINFLYEDCDCPCCSIGFYEQTNVILLSVLKINKKEKKIKIVYEIELKNKNKYKKYYLQKDTNFMDYFDKSICDSIEFLENKILFYIPQVDNVKIIDINSSFKPKYESILYNSSENVENYKIIFISEKCFFRYKYKYYKEDDEMNLDKVNLCFYHNNNKEEIYDSFPYDFPPMKKMNLLLFEFNEYYLTISEEIINKNE